MNGLAYLWHAAGVLGLTGWPGCLLAVAALALTGMAGRGLARRTGRTVPGPPAGPPVSVLVRRQQGIPWTGQLGEDEAEKFAEIVWHLRNDGVQRMRERGMRRVTSRRRAAIRRAKANVRTGRK